MLGGLTKALWLWPKATLGDAAVELDLQRFYNINRRALMWIVFFAILWLLRNFFAVMFLTFIFGFVMRKVAGFLTATTRVPHWASVVVPYLVVLTLLGILLTVAVPRVADEGAEFSRQVPRLLRTLAQEVKASAARYGLEAALAKYVNEAPPSLASPRGPDKGPAPAVPQPAAAEPGAVPPTAADKIDIEAMTNEIQHLLLGLLPGVAGQQPSPPLPELLSGFIRGVVGGTLQFLLAFFLSFLIVLDFDRIARELRAWRKSTVGRFFHEAAASVVEFSGAVGTAFQCQLFVAMLNASVTCIGLLLLDIRPLLLLTTIVFLLGLIPVLGVFISSVPIILIAFNEYGLQRALLALGVIVIVHLLEAYVFNPRIYAARFHLNPVIVLIILLVAHELFGIWGMLLGIPVTHYVLNLAQMPSRPRKQRQQVDAHEQTGASCGLS